MNISSKCAVLLLAELALLGAAPVWATEPEPSAAYRLQPGDVLFVDVWKEKELQQEVLVRPDGGFTFPLAGDVVAAQRSVEDLRTELETRLRHYIPDAVVTVGVKTVSGNRVYVIGKVTRPGDYMLVRPTDVLQALSLAGGMTPFADVNSIRVLRREHSTQTAFEFRYSDVEHGRHLEQNILLQGGDTVVVP
jgi:polysaccharide export outer membrane protein